MRAFICVCMGLVLLAACGGPRGVIVVSSASQRAQDVREIFVGTTRKPVTPGSADFGVERSPSTMYARFDVAIPANHASGTIVWPTNARNPDIESEFVTVDRVVFEGPNSFRRDLGRALQAQPTGRREAIVFVHGYNTNFAEAVYRLAQLGHDVGTNAALVSFSWPSRGKVLGYVYDRDSVLFSRDGLEALIGDVHAAGSDHIYLVGHSLGSHLVMETLRQMVLNGNEETYAAISGVTLISPDIDVDVFQAQASAIGALPDPFTVYTNDEDRALAFSAQITGTQERLGNVMDPDRVASLNVTLVDTTAYSVGSGHFNTGNSPELLSLLGQLELDKRNTKDLDRRPSAILPGMILTVRNATEIVLAPLAAANPFAR